MVVITRYTIVFVNYSHLIDTRNVLFHLEFMPEVDSPTCNTNNKPSNYLDWGHVSFTIAMLQDCFVKGTVERWGGVWELALKRF